VLQGVGVEEKHQQRGRWDDWMIVYHIKHTGRRDERRTGKERIESAHIKKYSIHVAMGAEKACKVGHCRNSSVKHKTHRGCRGEAPFTQ